MISESVCNAIRESILTMKWFKRTAEGFPPWVSWSRSKPGMKPIGADIGEPWIARGDCVARPRCGVEPEDTTGATCLAGPKNAVTICAEAPLVTEIRRRVRPVAPLNFRSGFRALACRTVAATDQTISWSRIASTNSDFTNPKITPNQET